MMLKDKLTDWLIAAICVAAATFIMIAPWLMDGK